MGEWSTPVRVIFDSWVGLVGDQHARGSVRSMFQSRIIQLQKSERESDIYIYRYYPP